MKKLHYNHLNVFPLSKCDETHVFIVSLPFFFTLFNDKLKVLAQPLGLIIISQHLSDDLM